MKIKWLVLVALTGSIALPSYALDYLGRIGIGGSYGRAWPTAYETFKNNTDDGPIWSGNLKVGIAHDTMLVASYSDITVESKRSKLNTELRPIILSLRYYAFHNSPINPYITAGAGVSRNTRELGNGQHDKYMKFAAQGGLGIEFFITPTASIGAEGLYHHIVASADESALRFLSAAGTVNFYFGSADSTKQARADANKAKEEAERAKAEAAANASAAAANAATAAQAQTDAQRQAEAAATAAQQEKAEADRKAAELQAQVQSAQADVKNIQDMIARKEMEPIMFATGSDKLLPQSSGALDKVSEVIAKYPNLKLRVEGHTDSVGNDASNMKLSQKRADSVKNYLVGKSSGTASQIDAVGFGESKPVASNDTAEGRAQNRRVEFLFALPN
jgi:outer membrane protein OmpA-like peptidoglycan-associated protein